MGTMTEAVQGSPEAPRPWSELRDEGLLWLINTTVFHPRGYAIGFHWPEDADPETDEPDGWVMYGNGSEPWTFADSPGAPPHRTLDAVFAAAQRVLTPAPRDGS